METNFLSGFLWHFHIFSLTLSGCARTSGLTSTCELSCGGSLMAIPQDRVGNRGHSTQLVVNCKGCGSSSAEELKMENM